VTFPVKVEYRGQRAKIYAPAKGFDYYRVSFRTAGKRRMLTFGTYSEAKQAAEDKVRELHRGQQSSALSVKESQAAIAIRDALDAYRHDTGRMVSAVQAVNEYLDAARKLGGRPLSAAVEGYLRTVASVKRKDLAEAVEEFLATEEPRTRTSSGERAQLSAKYHYNRAIHLRRFAGTFSGCTVCDLSKEHLDTFIGSKPVRDFSAKSRNHHRRAIAQFLSWCARKDYLPVAHRLLEADGMRPERANTAEVHCHTANELRALLNAAEGPMRAMIAIGGLAGLRTQELLRLDWADVWRVKKHIEVTAAKSKTRARRLVEICPALAEWLHPFKGMESGSVWPDTESVFVKAAADLWQKAGVARKPNGLRHTFCSCHFALFQNENATAALAGNSPQMIHSNYKGLVTKAEASQWFSVRPPKRIRNVVTLPAVSGKTAH
jgi:integrase